MPLPWYITTMTKVFSFPLLPIYPFILTLESMRGAFLGGTSLGLFVELPACPVESAYRELALLRQYLDQTALILATIPEPLLPLAGPWIDYYNACECFYQIACALALQKAGLLWLPKTCKECWEPEAESSPAP